MSDCPPELKPSDINIIETMYLFGRGYATAKILEKCIELKHVTIKKRLRLLRKTKWLKALKVDQYYVYGLTAKAIDLFDKNNYLQRMRHRNEKLEVIQDKLWMLNHFCKIKNEPVKVIYPFDKEDILKNILHLTDADLKPFQVGKSSQLFFNDVMYVNGYVIEELNIDLFPREKIFPATYLQNYLIKQYYLINAKLINQGIRVNFHLILNSERILRAYTTALTDKPLGVWFKVCSLPEDTKEFYQASPVNRSDPFASRNRNFDEYKIGLNLFTVLPTLIDFPHQNLI